MFKLRFVLSLSRLRRLSVHVVACLRRTWGVAICFTRQGKMFASCTREKWSRKIGKSHKSWLNLTFIEFYSPWAPARGFASTWTAHSNAKLCKALEFKVSKQTAFISTLETWRVSFKSFESANVPEITFAQVQRRNFWFGRALSSYQLIIIIKSFANSLLKKILEEW